MVSRIDKSAGTVVWSKSLTLSGDSVDGERRWYTVLTPSRLVAAQIDSGSNPSDQHGAKICCKRKADGSPAWDITLETPIASQPGIEGSRILVPLTTGEVECISLSSGSLLWRRQISSTHFLPEKHSSAPVLTLSVGGSICVARAGAQHFVGLDPSTGQQLWSRTISGSMRHAEQLDGDQIPFTLDRGVVYLSVSNVKVAAWSAAAAIPLWRRNFRLPKGLSVGAVGDPPTVTRDIVLIEYGASLAAVRRADGSVAWDRPHFAVNREPFRWAFFIDSSGPGLRYFLRTRQIWTRLWGEISSAAAPAPL